MWKKYWRNRRGTGRNKPLWLRCAAVGLAAALLFTGCGQSGDGSAQEGGSAPAGQSQESNSDNGAEGADGTQQIMGRYRESRVELPMELQYARDLWMDEEGLELLSGDGSLYRSQDQGQSWQPVSQAPTELREAMEKGTIFYFRQNSMGETVGGYLEFPAGENGEPSYEDSFFQNVLYAADGSRIPLSQLPEQEFVNSAACDEEGNFYLGSGSRIYRINGQDGSQEVLTELSSGCDYLTVCGKYLIIQGEQLQIFDLQTGKMGEQDTVLSEFLEPWLGASGDVGSRPYLLHQSRTEERSLYILTEKGLYRHALYGSVMEQVVDGSMCSMSNPSLGYVSMLQSGESFLVLYSGGQLMQYTYDANASAVPENILRVWGLYEDTDIQSVLSAFNQKYPDLYISYEHPLSEDTGMTREDAMKVLSTELAAGNGPDVLLLDDLPYDTYVEKGVLADLSEVLEGTGERYMEAVMDSYVRDGKQYAAPMGIRIPVLMGAADQLEGVTGLEALADLLEQARTSRPEGSLIGFGRAEEALRLLAPGSMGSWMTQAGGLDSEAVKEFLLQAKRIYEVQVSGLSVLEQERLAETGVYAMGEVRESTVPARYQ